MSRALSNSLEQSQLQAGPDHRKVNGMFTFYIDTSVLLENTPLVIGLCATRLAKERIFLVFFSASINLINSPLTKTPSENVR